MNNDEKERRLTPDSVQLDQDDSQTNNTPSQNGSNTDNEQTNVQQQNNSNKNNSRKISGYALKFNTPSKPMGKFTEIIDPNALDGVDLSNVYMLNDHDFTQVLASTKAGTLELKVDDVGLHFDATLPNTTVANDILENIKQGNVQDTSFGFDVDDGGDTFTKDDKGNVVRTIKKIKDLFDCSICAVGAYDLGADAVKVNTRSYEKWLGQHEKHEEKRDFKNMEQTVIEPTENNKQQEARSYEEYLRSAGESRDLEGLTTTAQGAVIPKDIITPILNLKESSNNLAKLINRKTVSSNSGTYPIGTATNATLATKEELAELANIDDPLVKGVEYKLQTRAGKIYLSQEIIDDSAVDIVGEVKAQLQRLVDNTDNTNLANVITKANNFQSATATNLDDVKKFKNTMLNPGLSLTVVTNQSGFNYLDTLKDSEGRYMLQEDVTAQTGKSLFGIPVAELSDQQLPNQAGAFPIFIGDLSQCLFEAYKPQVITQWQEFNAYSQGLSVVMRSDYQVIDKNSGVLITVKDGAVAGK